MTVQANRYIKLLFGLPHFEDEQDRSTADILNKVLLLSLLSVTLYSLSVLLGMTHLPDNVPNTSPLITLCFIILFVLLRQYQQVKWVSRLFCLSLWAMTTASLLTNGGVNAISLGVYQMLLLFSVFILTPKARNLFFLLCLSSMGFIYLAHLKNWMPDNRYDPETEFLAQQLYIIVMMFFALAIERTLIRNLRRARQSEHHALDNAERLRIAMNNMPMILFGHDVDLRYTWMYNDRFLSKPEHLIGKTDADILDPTSANTLMTIKRQAITNNQTIRQEVSFILGGERQWFDMTVNPVHDAQGKITGITCAAYNLRERKQAEAALAESEIRYRKMFEDNPQPMWVYDTETLEFLTVNDAAVEQYGYSRDEFQHMTIKDIRPPDDIPLLLETIAQGDNTSRDNIWRHRTKDGRERLVLISSHSMVFQGRLARLVLANDVTERQHSEEMLRRSEALFHTIFQSVPVAITLSDIQKSTLLNINDYFVSLTGYERNELLSLDMRDLPIWVSPPNPESQPEPSDWNQYNIPREIQWRTKDGNLLDMMVSGQRIDLGETPCILGIGIDITESKRASEREIESERMRLQVAQEREVVQLKEQFISRMSHEFRTPIAIILSSKEALQHYYPRLSEERRLEHFNEISKQIQYILELLESVLTIGKARAGKLEYQPEPIDLIGFCNNILNQIQLTDGKKHQFVFEAQGTFENVQMDERLLQHIFVNLLTNAVKYSPVNSEIRVELDAVENRARFRIRDQGIGMSEDDVARLGETFFRAANARRYQGTGLGMAIVKENVAAHGGTLDCESQLDKGTTFTVEIPLQPVQQKTAPPPLMNGATPQPIELRFFS